MNLAEKYSFFEKSVDKGGHCVYNNIRRSGTPADKQNMRMWRNWQTR